MDALYSSMPLDPAKKQVRLLTLHPCSTSRHIWCNIDVFSLLDFKKDVGLDEPSLGTGDDASTSETTQDRESCFDESGLRFGWGDYAAVSYMWGDPHDTKTIEVNGVTTQVTKNLAALLQELRRSYLYTNRLRLWIDALCINQNSWQERSQQVAEMRLFYSGAHSVVAYLGPEDRDSTKALRLMHDLASIHNNRAKCEALRDALSQHEFNHEPGAWLALNRLMSRPYWCRLWILQELALGGSRATILCGTAAISWPTFCKGLTVIHLYLWGARVAASDNDYLAELDANGGAENADVPDPDITSNANAAFDHVFKDIWDFTQIHEAKLQPASFSRLIETASWCNCSDPRDMCYGLLGVMDPALASTIAPDYSRSAAEVFTSVAVNYIRQYHDLELLRDANIWGKAGVPSWVPDWTWKDRLRDHRPESDKVYEPQEHNGICNEDPYQAAFGLPFNPPELCGRYLACSAVLLDTIDGLGCNHGFNRCHRPCLVQPSTSSGRVKISPDQIAMTLYGNRRPVPNDPLAMLHLPTSESRANELCTTLGWKRMLADIRYYNNFFPPWYRNNASFMIGGKKLKDYFVAEIDKDANEYDYFRTYTSWVRTIIAGGRRLTTTHAGRLGLVPSASCMLPNSVGEARRGDVFAVFPGCSTPILLRPTDEENVFRVFGEAYLHGAMEGEVLGMVQQGECSIQRIWLC
jgi:hypothetical protein